ncbi:MAG: hypothetical protein MHMPM18_001075 [Marteilia pararefringens]
MEFAKAMRTRHKPKGKLMRLDHDYRVGSPCVYGVKGPEKRRSSGASFNLL